MLTLEQQEARKHGIGGTDVAAIMGLSPFCTPYELWMIKTGKMEPKSILTDDRVRLRYAHEETIAREYAFRHECKLKRINKTIYHKKFPYMLCHLDRVMIGRKKIIECKSSTAFMKQHWGDHGTDQVFPHYIIQVQHQFACSGYKECDVAVLIDIDDYREFPIQRDNDIIKAIEDACDKFWNYHVKENVAPDLTSISDYKLKFPTNNGTYIEVNQEMLDHIDMLRRVRERQIQEEKLEDEILQKIFDFIGEADGIKQEDKVLATWKARKDGARVFRLSKL